jgi:hypothetical protein
MVIQNRFNEENLHQMQYALLTEVLGRWKVDIIESFLLLEEIDVVLIQEAVSHFTHITSFAPVKFMFRKQTLLERTIC